MTFLHDVVVPDRQQLLIPTIMVGFIVVLLVAGTSARAGGLDRTLAVAPSESEIEQSLVDQEHSIFRDQVSYDLQDRKQRIRDRYDREINAATSDIRAMIGAAMLYWTYNTPLYVLMPSSPEAFLGIEHDAMWFSRSEGYFMSADVPESSAVHLYREEKTTEFTEQVNSDIERNDREWTLEEYRTEIDRIMNVSYGDEELRSFLENNTNGSGTDVVFEDQVVEEHVRAGTVKQVGIIHFIPAIIANFLLYYLLFGMLTGLLGLVTGSDESTQEHQARQSPSQNRRTSSRSRDRS